MSASHKERGCQPRNMCDPLFAMDSVIILPERMNASIAMTVSIITMPPKVSDTFIVHAASVTQHKRPATIGTRCLRWGNFRRSDRFTVDIVRRFHHATLIHARNDTPKRAAGIGANSSHTGWLFACVIFFWDTTTEIECMI